MGGAYEERVSLVLVVIAIAVAVIISTSGNARKVTLMRQRPKVKQWQEKVPSMIGELKKPGLSLELIQAETD